ncbi:MAG: DUF4157 domain-containing protein [Planctomycetota bacterium]|nr:MAG: DUF4157 domain-containing protein [Planctomycetota bacterium]
MLNARYDARSSPAFTRADALTFDPRAGMGQSLIGHELTHVVQQRK